MSPRRREGDPPPTAKEGLVARLRERILGGELIPGTPLREEELAAVHGVSRHTVRAALARLGEERLVRSAPYRGARVVELSDDEVAAMQALRGALESEAVHLLFAAHGEAWPARVLGPITRAIDALEAAERNGDWPETTRAHVAFHRALVAAAGSERITEAYERLDSEILLLLTHVRPHYPSGTLAAEHREYLRAVQTGDAGVVRGHLAHTTELIRMHRS